MIQCNEIKFLSISKLDECSMTISNLNCDWCFYISLKRQPLSYILIIYIPHSLIYQCLKQWKFVNCSHLFSIFKIAAASSDN